MKKEPESNTDTSGRELVVSRTFNAPIELVWKVWTTPEHIRNWWGPFGFTNTIEHMDVRTGGKWEFVMHGPDGTDYRNVHLFKEIVPMRRIVLDHITGPKFEARIKFTAEGRRTHLRWHMIFESREQFEQVVKTFKADEGLKQNLKKLEQYLSGLC